MDVAHEERGNYVVSRQIDNAGYTFVTVLLLVFMPGRRIAIRGVLQARLMLFVGILADPAKNELCRRKKFGAKPVLILCQRMRRTLSPCLNTIEQTYTSGDKKTRRLQVGRN